MSFDAEILGHNVVLAGTIGELLYRLREHQGQTRSGQCYRLRMSEYDFRRLEGRPAPRGLAVATIVHQLMLDCQIGEPGLLAALLSEALQLNDGRIEP